MSTAPTPDHHYSFDSDHPAAAKLDDDQIGELRSFGEERAVVPGEYLFRSGDLSYDFVVILEGTVEILRVDGDAETVITEHGAGRFLGELNLLTGQRVFLSARSAGSGRVLAIPPPEFRRLMSSKPDLADVIFRALVARRDVLRSGPGNPTLRILGSRYSARALELRAFAARARLAHEWTDLEDADDVDALLASMGVAIADTPVVITPAATLRRPTVGHVAEHLGLTFRSPPGYLFDLVVVGSGPAGLAAAVYGASEGLDTVSLDSVGTGGQAGASSRIENYAGFPNGISGDELTARTAIQAQRLGARLNSPCEVAGIKLEEGFHAVVLADGSEVPTRAVIVASGARYRRLDVDGLERFEGTGVYYAATDLEVRLCEGRPVVVVGGGNSAGQAAIYLAQHGSHVMVAIRSDDLEVTMSRYLIERIEADPRIELLTTTEVRALAGDRYLETVTLEHTATGARREVECRGLFCFIGALPATGWLGGCVALDDRGFVLTDRALPRGVVAQPRFSHREPFPFETSVPGVFAVGDVRHGSLKRVAAAVGEGSSAVRSVHNYLASAG